jgi:hypothetical protein
MTPRNEMFFARAGEISERGARTGRHLQAGAFRDMWVATWQAVSRLAAQKLDFGKQTKHHLKL